MNETTTPIAETVERYLRFWSAPPGDEQRALGTAVFNESVGYRSIIGDRVGVEAMVALATEFDENVGKIAMRARTQPDVVGDRARLPWELLVDGESFAEGTDILEFDPDGHIAAVTAFLDRAPEGFDHHDH